MAGWCVWRAKLQMIDTTTKQIETTRKKNDAKKNRKCFKPSCLSARTRSMCNAHAHNGTLFKYKELYYIFCSSLHCLLLKYRKTCEWGVKRESAIVLCVQILIKKLNGNEWNTITGPYGSEIHHYLLYVICKSKNNNNNNDKE